MREPATHAFVVLCFHVGGRMQVEHHGELTLEAGDVHLVPAGDPHRMIAAERAEIWGVGFCRTCLPEERFKDLLAPLDRVRQGAVPRVTLPAERQAHVLTLLQEMEREQAQSGSMPIVMESLLGLVLAEVVRAGRAEAGATAFSSGEGRAAPSVVAEAMAVIEARCLGPLTLQEVAKAVRRSPAYLTTAVKEATGRTVVAWILEGRLAEARRRLRETDEHVEVIAERVGYADASQFTRMFRQRQGAAPAAWRAQQRRQQR
ncbi:helix-turn-helix transcriptional regulator [Chondromyces apiculatus]|nr:AraC family transcriptional regulator [Chondromyces apiculatus]